MAQGFEHLVRREDPVAGLRRLQEVIDQPLQQPVVSRVPRIALVGDHGLAERSALADRFAGHETKGVVRLAAAFAPDTVSPPDGVPLRRRHASSDPEAVGLGGPTFLGHGSEVALTSHRADLAHGTSRVQGLLVQRAILLVTAWPDLVEERVPG